MDGGVASMGFSGCTAAGVFGMYVCIYIYYIYIHIKLYIYIDVCLCAFAITSDCLSFFANLSGKVEFRIPGIYDSI